MCVYTVIKKKHLVFLVFGGLATFAGRGGGCSLVSEVCYFRRDLLAVLTLLSGERYIRGIVTIGTLRYTIHNMCISCQTAGATTHWPLVKGIVPELMFSWLGACYKLVLLS